MECVADALTDIKESDTLPQVLITGSLHLVGAALAVLDCDLYKYKEWYYYVDVSLHFGIPFRAFPYGVYIDDVYSHHKRN